MTSATRIKLRRDGNEKPTKHIILTFNATTLPDSVKAGYLNCKVRPFIPNPRRCFHCQRFGHSSQTCRGKPTCAKCGGVTPHPTEPCDAAFHCVNCGGSHPAYSRACPTWRKEKDVIALKVKENITYPEARRRLSFLQGGTFAAAVRRGPAPSTVSKETQVCPGDLAPPVPNLSSKDRTQRPHRAQSDLTSTAPLQDVLATPLVAGQQEDGMEVPRSCQATRPGSKAQRSKNAVPHTQKDCERMDTEVSSPPQPPPPPRSLSLGEHPSSKRNEPKQKISWEKPK